MFIIKLDIKISLKLKFFYIILYNFHTTNYKVLFYKIKIFYFILYKVKDY